MDIESDKYQLSQSLNNHVFAVRSLNMFQNSLMSGSMDKCANIFSFDSNSKKYLTEKTISFSDSPIYSVLAWNGGYIIGSADSYILSVDLDGNPVIQLEGHAGPVNSLAMINETTLISGSWDGLAKIWDLVSNKCIYTLEGHFYAVTVGVLQNGKFVVTGSQDGNIHIWDASNGKKSHTITKAHHDIIRDIQEIDGVGFVTCSNDETVKMWTFEGELIDTLIGHSSFVFSVKPFDLGSYVSAGEDRTLKIWKENQCIQTIPHPQTIWSVAINPVNQDIITACSDGFIRVFSKDRSRDANLEEIEFFEQNAQLSILSGPNEQFSNEELKKLDPVSKINQIMGKKDGDVKLFRNNNTAEAYAWKQDQQKWEKIGDVMGKNGKKKHYEGDRFFEEGDYDYIFDVDNGGGVVKKIPYNDGGNPLVSAELYCTREGISKSNIEQIRQFLIQNSRSISRPIQPIEEEVIQKTYKYFPISNPILFESMNQNGLITKMKELNSSLLEQNDQKSLNLKETNYFEAIVDILADKNNYPFRKIANSELLIIQKLVKWPVDKFIPVADFLRMLVLHHSSEQLFSGLDSGMYLFVDSCGYLQNPEVSEVLKSVIIKYFCNCVCHTSNKNGILRNANLILDALIKVSSNYTNTNLENSLAIFILNFTVAISYQQIPDDTIKLLCQLINNCIQKFNNANLLKVLASIGTLLILKIDQRPALLQGLVATQFENINPKQDQDYDSLQQCLQELRSIF